jgi:sporadic carbohydrate cluster protein (TIGR04323 family)
LKRALTYTLPRPFSNYNIPIAIQSFYIRDYCIKKKLIFSLPITEISNENCYIMFKKNFLKKKITLVMTSVFMLPIINKKLFNDVISGINRLSELHFVLENLVLKKKDFCIWVKEYNLLSKFSKNYSDFNIL